VLDTAGESIEPEDQDHIECASAGVSHKRLEARPVFLGTAHAVAVDLNHTPAPLLGQLPQWKLLDLGVLFEDRLIAGCAVGGAHSYV
jgi:hypothetical protein